MRKCTIDLNGETYLPLRAIPFVTGGIISPKGVVDLISGQQPEFSANAYLSDGVTQVPHEVCLTINGQRDRELPAGILIPYEGLRRVWFSNCILPNIPFDGDEPPSPWLGLPSERVLISKGDYDFVMQGIKNIPRANARDQTMVTLRRAMDDIKAACAKHGVNLELDRLQGTKKQIHELVTELGVRNMSLGTFDTYAEELGWRWRLGAKSANGEEMVKAVKMEYQRSS